MIRRACKWVKEHAVLALGYGLLLALIATGATAYTSHLAREDLRGAVATLTTRHTQAVQRIQKLQTDNLDLHHTVAGNERDIGHLQAHDAVQDAEIAHQRRAIDSLERLRRANLRALAGLRDELAFRNVRDTNVLARLSQLEKDNAAAHAVITSSSVARQP